MADRQQDSCPRTAPGSLLAKKQNGDGKLGQIKASKVDSHTMQPFHELSISYLTLLYSEELWGLTVKSSVLILNFLTPALSLSLDTF